MKMKKKIIIAVCIIVVIIIAGITYTLTNLDSIVKSIIENTATNTIGTEVTVSKVDISLSKGEATINNFKVANPEGFSDQPMISLGKITAQIDYKTYAVKNIHIDNPEFSFEQKGTRTNFGVVQQNLSKKSADTEKTPNKSKETTKDSKPEKGKKGIYQIDSFTINNAKVHAVSLDTGNKATASVSNIHFNDLKGTPKEICQQIFIQLTTQIIQQTTNSSLQNIIKQNVKGDLGNTINSQINNILGR